MAPPGDWAPDDWRRTQPAFPPKLALALHVYTLQDPRVYGALGRAMHAAPEPEPEQASIIQAAIDANRGLLGDKDAESFAGP